MQRFLPALFALLGPLLVFGAGLRWISVAGQRVDNPALAPVLDRVQGEGVDVLLLGNSVTEAGLDSGLLSEVLGLDVAHAGISGALPPHWLALLRHQVHAQGGSARVVLTYVPSHNLGDTDVSSANDLAMLLDLGGGSDAALLEATGQSGEDPASQPAPSRLATFHRDRQRARDGLLRGLTDLAFGYVPGSLEQARESVDKLMGEVAPNDPGARFQATPGQGGAAPTEGPRRGGDGGRGRSNRLADSVMPDLIEEAQGHGARVVVVHPAARPDTRPACAGDGLGAQQDAWLTAQGVDVLDLTFAPLASGDFSSQHHLTATGRERLGRLLGELLVELAPQEVAPRAPGRRWVLDCQGRRAP